MHVKTPMRLQCIEQRDNLTASQVRKFENRIWNFALKFMKAVDQ